MITPDTAGNFVLGVEIAAAYACVRADLGRRRVKVSALLVTGAIVAPGMAAFVLLSRVATAGPLLLLVPIAIALAAIRVTAYFSKANPLIIADVSATAASLLSAIACLASLTLGEAPQRLWAIGFAIALVAFLFLWHEGKATMQWQRPDGIVFAEFLALAGMTETLYGLTLLYSERASSGALAAGLFSALAGACLLAVVLRRYFKTREEHRIITHTGKWGESLQPEYTPPSPECPFPERWKMYDTMTAEAEVLEFLTCLVTTLKPNLIVETGSFAGISTLALAEGLQKNGFGKIISCEFDSQVFARARQRIAESGLAQWIDLRNESSLDMSVAGTIDLLFSDSDENIRGQEVRTFLPQMNPHGLILMHDAGTHYGTVRKAALAMEQEGLISLVLVSTPRGLAIAQKARVHSVASKSDKQNN
jgi:predicted O-methyltransferase YrrM